MPSVPPRGLRMPLLKGRQAHREAPGRDLRVEATDLLRDLALHVGLPLPQRLLLLRQRRLLRRNLLQSLRF